MGISDMLILMELFCKLHFDWLIHLCLSSQMSNKTLQNDVSQQSNT